MYICATVPREGFYEGKIEKNFGALPLRWKLPLVCVYQVKFPWGLCPENALGEQRTMQGTPCLRGGGPPPPPPRPEGVQRPSVRGGNPLLPGATFVPEKKIIRRLVLKVLIIFAQDVLLHFRQLHLYMPWRLLKSGCIFCFGDASAPHDEGNSQVYMVIK